MNDAKFVQIEKRDRYRENEYWEMMSALYSRKWENLLPAQLWIEELPIKRANNFVTPPDAPVPDCLPCGACCKLFSMVGVRATDDPPPETALDVTDETGEIVVDSYLKRDATTLFCQSLKPTADGLMPCGIYERRPHVCGDFEAGSDRCHGIRRAYGFEPFLTLQEMSDAQRILESRKSGAAWQEMIRDVKIVRQAETGNFEIVVEMRNGDSQTLHVFDPHREAWREFQFRSLTLADARRLIEQTNEATATD